MDFRRTTRAQQVRIRDSKRKIRIIDDSQNLTRKNFIAGEITNFYPQNVPEVITATKLKTKFVRRRLGTYNFDARNL
jgi:hypothetical protein